MIERITDKDVLRDVLWDDAEGYTRITETDRGYSRWHRSIETVFKRDSDEKLFIAYWRCGATEYQDNEYPDEAVEAEEYTETKTVVLYRQKVD